MIALLRHKLPPRTVGPSSLAEGMPWSQGSYAHGWFGPGFGNKMRASVRARGGWEFSKVLIWRSVTEWQFVETETIRKGRSI